MKVLYITTMYPTPAFPQKGIFCHEQVKALISLGIDVDVAVPIPFYDREVNQHKWQYEGINVTYVRFFKLPGARDFHKSGKRLYCSLKFSFDLNKYDLYHADTALPSGQAAMIASKKYNKPFVVHGHGLDVFLENSYKDYYNCSKIVSVCKEIYRCADAICGVSLKVINEIQKEVNLKGTAHVVYNGVDTQFFYPTKKTDTNKYILSVGNLIPLKGHDDTIRAFAEFIQQGNFDVKLIIAGRGELENELKELTRTLKVSDYVEFVGYVPYSKIRDLMQKATIFSLPSWYEALGCVYLEAMACGIPVIGCRGNGIDEIIVDKENGFLVDKKSPKQICDIFNDVVSKGNLYCGKKGYETVINGYTWHHSAKSLLNVYSEVLN